MSAPVLDYSTRVAPRPANDAGLLLVSGVVAGLFGLTILGGLAEAIRETWPSFGMALIAVPIGLVAFAFLTLSATAFRGVRAGGVR